MILKVFFAQPNINHMIGYFHCEETRTSVRLCFELPVNSDIYASISVGHSVILEETYGHIRNADFKSSQLSLTAKRMRYVEKL